MSPRGQLDNASLNESALVIGTNVWFNRLNTFHGMFVSSKGRGQTQERAVGFEPTTTGLSLATYSDCSMTTMLPPLSPPKGQTELRTHGVRGWIRTNDLSRRNALTNGIATVYRRYRPTELLSHVSLLFKDQFEKLIRLKLVRQCQF